MNKRLLIIFLAATLCGSAPLSAQFTQEVFMLESTNLGYKFNPALASYRDFVGSVSFSGNLVNSLGARAFLYPTGDGKLVTALHPSITAERFLSQLRDNNHFNGSANFGLFSYGFKKGKSFHTIEVNLRAKAMTSVPKSVFEMAKLGSSHSPFDFAPIRANMYLFGELAYGYTRKLGDFVTVGARAKLLKGFLGADLNLSQFDVVMDGDAYTTTYSGTLDMTTNAIRFLPVEKKDPGKQNTRGSFNSIGVAADLGVVIKPFEGLMVSLSVLDLGGIMWRYKNAGTTSGSQSFSGLNLEYEDLNGEDILANLNDKLNEFYATMDFQRVKNRKVFDSLPLTFNAGVRYTLPFYNNMSVGLTGTIISTWPMSYRDIRFGVTERCTDWLEITANAGRDNFGMVYGFAAVARASRFRFSAGSQGNFARQVPETIIPVKPAGRSLNLGVTYDI